MKPSHKWGSAVFALALSVTTLLAGCSSAAAPAQAPQGTQSSTPASATTPAGQAGGIKIGLIAPLTGDVKTFGESQRNAFNLAIEEAAAEGKLKIDAVVVDDKNDPTEGVNAANKLITQDGVKAIVGPLTSKVSIAVSEVTQSNKVVQISGTATNPKFTVDNGKRKDYVFRACFIDPFQGNVMAKFALNTLKAKTAAILFDAGNDYTVGLKDVFTTAFEQGGGKVLVSEAYATKDVDFSAILTKVAAANPDVLFLPDYYNKVNLIAAQVREKGIQAKMLGADGWDSAELDTKALEGSYFSNHYSPEDQRPEVQSWVKKYQDKYGAVPDALATLGYDATKLMLEAIAKAGSDDPTKIRDAMAAIKDFKGVTGTLSFDKDGNPIKDAVVLEIKDGKQKYVETLKP